MFKFLKKLHRVFVIIIPILAVVVAIITGFLPLNTYMRNPNFIKYLFVIVYSILFIAFGPLIFSLISSAVINAKRKKRLKQIGVKTEAKIINVEDTNSSINQLPIIKLTVEVQPGIQSTFSMAIARFQKISPGDMIEIVYDPSDPKIALPASSL